jgi:uncharacterized protein (TIGR03435 family)
VSIKRNTADRPPIGVPLSSRRTNGGIQATWISIEILLSMAYPGLGSDRFVGLPDWATRDRYDVIATSPLATATEDQRLAMLRAMLADRLKLAVHLEKRPHDVLKLVVARADGRLGSSLTKIDTDCAAVLAARQAAVAAGGPPAPHVTPEGPLAPCLARGTADLIGNSRIEGEGTIDTVALLLRGAARQVVVNETGLTGSYKFALTFDRRTSFGGPSTTVPDDAGPSIFTAIQDQLGLKLVPAREDQDTVVVDHIEPP